MSEEKQVKRVFRILMAWNDEREGRWLAEQERSGWRVRSVNSFGYVFERSSPAEVAYRLDYGPPRSGDRSEYFGLFRDAGWEHVGRRGLWQVFRKPVVDGEVPEIHTDPGSRIANYQRLLGLAGAMLGMLIVITAVNLNARNSIFFRHPTVFALYLALMAVYVYSIVRLILLIGRLRRRQDTHS